MFFRNIKVYHTSIDIRKAIMSILISVLFNLDIVTDVAYLREKGLERVEINERIYNFRLYLTISLLSPLTLEIIGTWMYSEVSKGLGWRFKIIEVFARLINQEKCLEMPERKKDLETYDREQSKTNADKKVKFVIFEDSAQIAL